MDFPAMFALPRLTAKIRRTAVNDILHGFDMAGQDVILVLVMVIGSVLAEDVRQGAHRSAMALLVIWVGSGRSFLMSWV